MEAQRAQPAQVEMRGALQLPVLKVAVAAVRQLLPWVMVALQVARVLRPSERSPQVLWARLGAASLAGPE